MKLKVENKKVLVTGGAGFIGGAMVKALLSKGAVVDVLDNLSVGKRSTVPEGVDTFIRDDLCEDSLEDTRKDFRFDLEKLKGRVVRNFSSLISAPFISENRERFN